jgi:hypothetical protein
MSSLLKPGYTLTLGNQQWTQQLLTLELKLAGAPLLDVLTVALPFRAPISASPGDDAKLSLNNGEGNEDVFTGTIDSIRHSFDQIRITALDAGAKLAQYRPATTYEQITAGTLIRNLCGDVGADTGNIDDGPSLAFYAADPSRTALEHIARVCDWSGAMGRVSAGNEVESVVVNGTTADLALKYGRELLGLDQSRFFSSINSFVVAGESAAGSTDSPDALRPTTDFFAGNRPDGPSAGNIWRFEPALRTAQAAGTAGAARSRLYKSGRQGGTLEAFLQPKLRPGTVFEIQELPEPLLKGPFWIRDVTHRLSRERSYSRACFNIGGSDFDPAALLGSLLGSLF